MSKYRLAVKDGTYKTVLDYGRIVESEHYGSDFLCIGSGFANLSKHTTMINHQKSKE